MFRSHAKRLCIGALAHAELGVMMGIAAVVFGIGVGVGVRLFKVIKG